MKKYMSDIIKPEDIKISTSRFVMNEVGYSNVTINYMPLNLTVSEDSAIGQLDAYNKCIHRLEFRVKFGEFKSYYEIYPDKFVEHFLGIELKWYQKAMLRRINKI